MIKDNKGGTGALELKLKKSLGTTGYTFKFLNNSVLQATTYWNFSSKTYYSHLEIIRAIYL